MLPYFSIDYYCGMPMLSINYHCRTNWRNCDLTNCTWSMMITSSMHTSFSISQLTKTIMKRLIRNWIPKYLKLILSQERLRIHLLTLIRTKYMHRSSWFLKSSGKLKFKNQINTNLITYQKVLDKYFNQCFKLLAVLMYKIINTTLKKPSNV